jgi:PBP1b-binding outer membrane lipoprotein LpoB
MSAKWSFVPVVLAVGVAATLGCGPRGKTVERIDPNEEIDLSGRWNDTDSKRVAQTMINDCLTRRWRSDHWERFKKRPVIIVGQVRNKTSEHIAVGTFIGDMERTFINSGEVEMVASPEERDQIRDERADQQEFSSDETMKQWGREHGADYMLIGVINSIEDRERGEMVIFYQVDLTLIDLERNTKVWQGQEKIKKYITMGSYSP